MHRGRRKFLLDAVAVGGIFQCRYRDDVDIFGQGIAAAGDMIAAGGEVAAACEQQHKSRGFYSASAIQRWKRKVHSTSFSASLMAVAAGKRILSAAPQKHQAPGRESSSGRAKWIAESPEAFRLPRGEAVSESRVNPALRQDSMRASFDGLEFRSAMALKV